MLKRRRRRRKIRPASRLDSFYDELKKIHQEHFCDWRFAQLWNNFISTYKTDMFYCEDDRLLLLFKIYAHDFSLDLSNEIWKPVKDYEEYYEVSNLGRVRSLDRYVNCANGQRLHKGKILQLEVDRLGYRLAHVSKDGKDDRLLVHRMVAEAFIDNPEDYPCVNHKDETPWNNKISNLEWCTYAYNNQYNELNQKRFKTRSNNIVNGITKIGTSILMKDLNGNIVKEYTNMERVKDAGLSEYYVRLCCDGKKESYLAHKWEYGTKW